MAEPCRIQQISASRCSVPRSSAFPIPPPPVPPGLAAACSRGSPSAVLLTGCGAPAPPSCHRVPRESRQPTDALLTEARADWATLSSPARRSRWPSAQDRYNRAVTALFDQLRCNHQSWPEAAAALGTTVAPRGPATVDPTGFTRIFPADQVDVSKSGPRHRDPGVGVPVVGWISQQRARWKTLDFPPPTGVAASLTVVLTFPERGPPQWQFRRPFRDEQIRTGGVTHDLAADWSAAPAFYWEMSELDDMDLIKVFVPERVAHHKGLFMTHAYDPRRIPVLFVHGLNSSPATFRTMISELEGQPWFRKRYQAWIYSYPTASSWLLSSATFRREVTAAVEFGRRRGGATTLDKMVVVAHSMGGLVSGLSLREPGNKLYDTYFSLPADQLQLSAKERRMLDDTLLFDPLPSPARVVFLAVPHQGSPTAGRFLSNLVANLIRLPKTLTVELGDIILQNLRALGEGIIGADASRIDDIKGAKFATSINSLSPSSRLFRVVPGLPFRPGLRIHSVIGDRGRGDTPQSSDGLVPYWSSHIDQAESELIVPDGHTLTADPQVIAEVERILRQHAAAE